MAPFKTILLASVLAASQLVAGHSVIIKATGDAGGEGSALGVVSSTPRDGTRRNPFQQDATRFRGQSANTVGETVGAGANNIEQGTASILAESGQSLPQVTPGGEVQMTLHQVNGDGAGPYKCMINSDGTGTKWDNIQVTTNVDGRNGNNRQGAKTDFPLAAAIPANQQCTGNVAGESNVCLVRCQNQARAGPFGGVVPVQMAAAANNGNANNGNANNGNANNGNAGNKNGNAKTGNAKTGNAGNAGNAAGNRNKNNNNANNNANKKRDDDPAAEATLGNQVESVGDDEETEADIIALEEIDVDAPARRAVKFSA